MTTIYETQGWQTIEQQTSETVTMYYTVHNYEEDPQPHLAGGDMYTRIWAKSLEALRETIEKHAGSKEVILIEKER